MENDLLVHLANKYDQIPTFVKHYVGDNLFRVSPKLIHEVFNLNPNHVVHKIIDMDDLQARYDAQRVYLRVGPLQQHFTRIGTLPLVTPTTLEPLMRKFFNPKAQALYFSLCQIFGMEEGEYNPSFIVLIMTQTLQFGITNILDFASFLVEEIHNGLVGISKGEVNRPFC